MKTILQQEIFYIEFWHILAITISIFLNTYIYLHSKKNRLLYFFIYLQSTTLLWMAAKILKTVSPTIELRWSFIVLQYFSICLLEGAFLEFSFIYMTGKRFLKKTRLILYFLLSLQFSVIITNPYHMKFYSSFNFYDDSFGPLFYFFMCANYSVIFTGVYWCGIKMNKLYKNKIKTKLILYTAILFPLIFNIIFVTGFLNKFFKSIGILFVFDITPIAFTLSLFIFVFAIFKYEFLDVLPVLNKHIINFLDSPVVVLDNKMNLIEYNNSAISIYKFDTKDSEFDFSVAFNKISGNLLSTDKDRPIVLTISDSKSNHIFRIRNIPIHHKNSLIGTIIFSDNITDIIKLTKLLEDKNSEILSLNEMLLQKIEIEKKSSNIKLKNLVARELHDILGHSMTLVISLLETARLYNEKDIEIRNKSIKSSLEILRSGYADLKKSISGGKYSTKDTLDLKLDIETLISNFSRTGMFVKLYFGGDQRVLTEIEYNTIKRICQEALTNSSKHGNASNAILSLKFIHGKTILNIIDTGLGCKKIKPGNGLKNMRHRIDELGGRFSFSSNEGEGFIIYAEF